MARGNPNLHTRIVQPLLLVLLFLLLATPIHGVRIYGAVYDLSLQKAEQARVAINSTPHQMMVTENGSYSFTVPRGSYRLEATMQEQGETIRTGTENITITRNGSFRLDLIMDPSFGDEEELLSPYGRYDPVQEEVGFSERNPPYHIVAIAALCVFLGGIIILRYRRPRRARRRRKVPKHTPAEPEDEYERLLKILRENDGRMTQRELRKHYPMSEAKMSLLIQELEQDGKVEKFKKGRGNIIRLKSSR